MEIRIAALELELVLELVLSHLVFNIFVALNPKAVNLLGVAQLLMILIFSNKSTFLSF